MKIGARNTAFSLRAQTKFYLRLTRRIVWHFKGRKRLGEGRLLHSRCTIFTVPRILRPKMNAMECVFLFLSYDLNNSYSHQLLRLLAICYVKQHNMRKSTYCIRIRQVQNECFSKSKQHCILGYMFGQKWLAIIRPNYKKKTGLHFKNIFQVCYLNCPN